VDLFGTAEWNPDFDYKQSRQERDGKLGLTS